MNNTSHLFFSQILFLLYLKIFVSLILKCFRRKLSPFRFVHKILCIITLNSVITWDLHQLNNSQLIFIARKILTYFLFDKTRFLNNLWQTGNSWFICINSLSSLIFRKYIGFYDELWKNWIVCKFEVFNNFQFKNVGVFNGFLASSSFKAYQSLPW